MPLLKKQVTTIGWKKMTNYQELAAPSASTVYKNVNQAITSLTNALATSVFDRVTENLDFQDSFNFSTFFSENLIKPGTDLYHIFQSEHYRKRIFRNAENMLWKHGYNVRLEVDETGRSKKIKYDARVISPWKRTFDFVSPLFVGFALTYGTTFVLSHAYNYYLNVKKTSL